MPSKKANNSNFKGKNDFRSELNHIIESIEAIKEIKMICGCDELVHDEIKKTKNQLQEQIKNLEKNKNIIGEYDNLIKRLERENLSFKKRLSRSIRGIICVSLVVLASCAIFMIGCACLYSSYCLSIILLCFGTLILLLLAIIIMYIVHQNKTF